MAPPSRPLERGSSPLLPTTQLALVRQQPPSPDRDQRELSLLIAVGAPLTAAKGYSVPEVEQTYRRAGELCVKLGDDRSAEFFRALYGTWRVHLLRADYVSALEFARRLMRIAEAGGNGTQLGAAHRPSWHSSVL